MQPTFTHVPPSWAASATTTLAPRCAARRAARTPPLPAPMTKRSMSVSAMAAMMAHVQRQGEEAAMKVLKWLLWVVLALVAVLVIGGWLLSPRFTVSRSVVIQASPDK